MSIRKPKNPAEMTAQLRMPAATVLADISRGAGVEMGCGAGAGGAPVDEAFVIMRVLNEEG